MKTFFSLLYIISFIALIAILDHRNTEVTRWIHEQERVREIMLAEEFGIQLDMPIAIKDIKVRK